MPYKKVKESQRLYQNLIESVDVGILSFDKDGKIFQGNRKASKLFDLAEGEGIGRSFKDIISEKHVHLIDEMVHNCHNERGNDKGGIWTGKLTADLEKSDIFPGSSPGPQLYEVRVYKWE